MKKINLLIIATTTVLLTACGGGGGGGISVTTNPTGLTQNYAVPANLQSLVNRSKQFPIKMSAPQGHSPIVIDGKHYQTGDVLDYGAFPMGYSEHKEVLSNKDTVTITSKLKVYNMPYSTVIGRSVESVTLNNATGWGVDPFVDGVGGYRTVSLPTEGKATYTGVAMDAKSHGAVSLNVDFRAKSVTGNITGLSSGDILLGKGNINTSGKSGITFAGPASISNPNIVRETIAAGDWKKNVTGNVYSSDYTYSYGGKFYGPNAEEVTGYVDEDERIKTSDGTRTDYVPVASFGAQRGEIKK